MTKYALDLISGKLTQSDKSHKNGWAYLRKCQLEDALDIQIDVLHGESWDEYDVIFLYHSMEQDGNTLNLFGGATEEGAKWYERLITYQDKQFISLDIPMPDYGKLCKGRLKSCDQYWANINWDKVSKICSTIEMLEHPELTQKLVIGDSHSFSAYQSGYMTFRKDGRTLNGVLKKTIEKEINDFNPEVLNNGLTHLTVYYGNIDIRHHWMREADPFKTIDDAVQLLEQQLISLNIPNIELVCPLPIEDESRRLPKTGYYKGAPFFGTRDERVKIMEYYAKSITKITEKNGWTILKWPDNWYTMDPIEYMKTHMESPKSVHLAPKFHRWNYWKNELNSIKENKLIEF